MIAWKVEKLCDVWREMEALFPLHFAETGGREKEIDVDWPRFFAMERDGIAHVVVARDDGRMMGYFVGIIAPNLHNRKLLTAVSDMYFLHPDYRGYAGVRMFREIEKAWRQMGVEMATITCKVSREYGRIFEYLGWQLEERIYMKNLGE